MLYREGMQVIMSNEGFITKSILMISFKHFKQILQKPHQTGPIAQWHLTKFQPPLVWFFSYYLLGCSVILLARMHQACVLSYRFVSLFLATCQIGCDNQLKSYEMFRVELESELWQKHN